MIGSMSTFKSLLKSLNWLGSRTINTIGKNTRIAAIATWSLTLGASRLAL